MKTYTFKFALFNGRYWTTSHASVRATNVHTAYARIGRVVEERSKYKRPRIKRSAVEILAVHKDLSCEDAQKGECRENYQTATG